MISKTLQTSHDKQKPVLILGAGLTGLSAAFHLKKFPRWIVERESQIGGTARSFQIKGFTFDITGHLLHLHNPKSRKLIRHLLGRNINQCVRNTWIYLEGCTTRYPFQANSFGLPEKTVDECVIGFLNNYFLPSKRKENYTRLNFRDWCYQTFGKGVSKKFMIPYNEKLFQRPARNLTSDWCGPFVPKPSLEDVIKGALEPFEKRFGYNATFLYPKRGGIQSFPDAIKKRLKNTVLQTGNPVKSIEWEAKKAHLASGTSISYKNLINTAPLPDLLKMMKNLPPGIRKEGKKLKVAGIVCINMGVKRPQISDKSWIYFPEDKFPFYRVGFPTNFSSHVAPKKSSSMYIEIPMKRANGLSRRTLLSQVKKGLKEAGILKVNDVIPVVQILPVPNAYVIYDQNRNTALKKIFLFLKKHGIISTGRYGGWKYSFMEEAILDGQKAAAYVQKHIRT